MFRPLSGSGYVLLCLPPPLELLKSKSPTVCNPLKGKEKRWAWCRQACEFGEFGDFRRFW
jgi:hypothetical protein